jgi:hypothetical protein
MAQKALWERMSGSQLIFCVNFINAFGIFFEGWNQGNMGFVNASPDYIRLMQLGDNGVITNTLKEGGIVAIYYLGAAIGGLLGGHVADQYGRVKAVLSGCFWVIIGGSLMVRKREGKTDVLHKYTEGFLGSGYECPLDALLSTHRWIRCRLLHHYHPRLVG